MFAYIKNDEVSFISNEKMEGYTDGEIIEYNDEIIAPAFKDGAIQESFVDVQKIINDISALPTLNNFDKSILQGVSLTKEQVEEIKIKRMYKEGVQSKLTKLLFMMAEGNFSAGQELGWEMKEEYDAVEGLKNTLMGKE